MRLNYLPTLCRLPRVVWSGLHFGNFVDYDFSMVVPYRQQAHAQADKNHGEDRAKPNAQDVKR